MVIRSLIVLLMVLQAGTLAAAAQEATPSPDVACAVAPRPVEEMLDLWFDSTGTPRVTGAPDGQANLWALDLTQGEPVDASVTRAIEEVAQEWVACSNAGDLRRTNALFTDAYVAARGAAYADPELARGELERPPSPVSPDLGLAVGPPHDARRFADGRVGATFAVTGVRQPGVGESVFMLFEETDGRWRIDDLLDLIAPPPVAPVWGYRVVAAYPHDPNAYTQGLVFVDGVLYEGTGQEGESSLRRVDLYTGTVLQIHRLDYDQFGEGTVVMGDRIYQITWKDEVAFVYDRETFEVLQTFVYDGQGWGLTTDGERLIMSDGSSRIVFRDPATFEVTGSIDVQDAGLPVSNLNELEYVDGEIWANVYTTDWIVRIDPATGDVTGWIDMSGLRRTDDPRWETAEVLNGIAWDPDTGRLFVTGKYWPEMFQIELVPPE